MSHPQTDQSYDVVIVGAGAAGIGCGVVLKELGLEHFTILDRHQVGASFSRWPEEMNFITPSFPSHGFGLLDLNAVTLKTSPAIAFRREHISGKQYALYLQTVADHFELPIQTEIDVQSVTHLPQGGFTLRTSSGEISTQFVIWAAGEYQYPRLNTFPGAEHCVHNSQIQSWTDLEGDEFIIIGGYESGMDAAANLVAIGKKVGVLDRTGAWANPDTDPSVSLSPYTLQRLEFVYNTGRLDLVGNAPIEEVKPISGGYAVYSEYQKWVTAHPPILCTGFDTSLKQISPLFDWSKGYAALTENDESTLTPGLFVSGPSVRHGDLIFCFIYKFRQRFAVIANAIAQRLSIDPTPLDAYRQAGLFLDDLSCCDNDCIC
ncbi:NAD(P)-binding domain-containing protein [Adonisia turfae]|uniref:Monooxygenase n=1 Tax=Adonisia turfae CCMR0081 TaxID=2292702 RepID=A0A6M0RN40_9CYAN|nr:monooxygenase [Adonisia turfae CCMR0081]